MIEIEDKLLEKYLQLIQRVSKMPAHLQERLKIQDQACYLLLTDEQKNIKIEVGQVWKSREESKYEYRVSRYDDLGFWNLLGVNNKSAIQETENYLKLYYILKKEK